VTRFEADLHTHTTASDGTEPPERLVARAIEAGLRVLAVTDHDTVAGVPVALEAARGTGLAVIAGVELSSRNRRGDVHVLGLFVPHDDPAFLLALAERRAGRLAAVTESVRRLRALGVPITLDEVLREASGEAVGRPHIARAMVRAGVVPTIEEAFTPRYIADGGAAHVPSRVAPPEEAVHFLRAFGAVPVIAHPGAFGHGDRLEAADLAALVPAGLVGVEVYHPAHDGRLRAHYVSVAERLDLVASGGSDWHGPRQGRALEPAVAPGEDGVGLATVETLAGRVGRPWPEA
jgi:predicted metal-dependent phosphoesterase TrpH